jgi:hypothetical protein
MLVRLQFTLFIALAFVMASAVAELPSSRVVIQSELESFLLEIVQEERFTGVALAMSRGAVLHARGYGFTSGEAGNRVKTCLPCGVPKQTIHSGRCAPVGGAKQD